MRTLFMISLSIFILLLLAGCSGFARAGASPTATLTTYLTALANKDEAKMTTLVCPDWQDDALLELDSFQAVQTSLQGVSCSQTSSENQAALVNCQGKILARYVDQTQEFDLSGRVYKLEKNGADWQVCGYTTK